MTDTYMIVVIAVVVVAAEHVIWKSVLKNVNQKRGLHMRGCDEEVVRERKKEI
jgi:hypothetical protein